MAEEKLQLQEVGSLTKKVGRPKKGQETPEKHVNGKALFPGPKL
jgi:hypothetical protein